MGLGPFLFCGSYGQLRALLSPGENQEYEPLFLLNERDGFIHLEKSAAFLSSMDVSDVDKIVKFLVPSPESLGWLDQEEYDQIIQGKVDKIMITYLPRLVLAGENGLELVFCDFRLETESCFWRPDHSLYFDLPSSECYRRIRQLEETFCKRFPMATFINRVGICNECGSTVEPHEHQAKYKDCEQFFCDSCWNAKGVSLMLLDGNEHFFNREILRVALYEAYEGKCQYCSIFAKPRPLKWSCTEHIIPRAIPLNMIPSLLMEMGISEDMALNFCKSHLPPFHNSILNLTLSCPSHNKLKGNELLHPAGLEFLLVGAKKKAKNVLEIYFRKANNQEEDE